MATATGTASALAKVKQAAIEKYEEAKSKAKETLISTVKSKVKDLILQYLKVPVQVTLILSAVSKIKETVQTAAKTYSAAKTTAATVKAQAMGGAESIIEGLRQAAEAYKNSKLNSAGIDVDFGILEKVKTLAVVDPSIEPDSSDPGLILKLNGAKVKLNSIDELVDAVQTINRKLNSEDVATTRSWVHTLSKMHPLVDDRIKDLEYFKPISNEVGSTYLQHTPDTATLALGDWKTKLPIPIRKSLEVKVGDVYSKVHSAYYELNNAMTRNLSTEFYYNEIDEALMSQGNNYLNKTLLSNDYHIAGDFTFAETQVGKLEQVLMTALITYVGGAGKLISWLSPVNSYDVALCGGVMISVEGKNVTVDLKGNKVGVIATIIDESPITIKDNN